jgi:DNA-binding response OmpR family regulator
VSGSPTPPPSDRPRLCDDRLVVEVVVVGAQPARSALELVERLRAEGHRVRTARNVGDAELARRSGPVDVVIALEDAAEVRRRIDGVPVVAWLGSRSTERAAELLELGIDEVIDGGMGPRELLARIAALAGRAPAPAGAVSFGPLRVDRERGEATWHGRRLQLTPREREVLQVLVEAQGATVRREALYRAVWGYAMARGDRTVDVNVKRLRDKLAAAVGGPLAIETEPAVGYRLALAEPAVTAL